VREQLPDPLGQQGGPVRRDQDARRAVHHGVHVTADRGSDDGVPHAMACSEVVPAGSYWQVLTTRSADRSRAGIAVYSTLPMKITRSATPSAAANLASST